MWLASKEGYEFLCELLLLLVLVFHPVRFSQVCQEGDMDALKSLEEGSLQEGCSHYQAKSDLSKLINYLLQ